MRTEQYEEGYAAGVGALLESLTDDELRAEGWVRVEDVANYVESIEDNPWTANEVRREFGGDA